jgi:hypothetical protein
MMEVLMEIEDEHSRYDLELYRQSPGYSGPIAMTCAQDVIDVVGTSRLFTVVLMSTTFHLG